MKQLRTSFLQKNKGKNLFRIFFKLYLTKFTFFYETNLQFGLYCR
jgi:hypothetical protein